MFDLFLDVWETEFSCLSANTQQVQMRDRKLHPTSTNNIPPTLQKEREGPLGPSALCAQGPQPSLFGGCGDVCFRFCMYLFCLVILFRLFFDVCKKKTRQKRNPTGTRSATCLRFGGQPFVLSLDSSTFRSPGGGKENGRWSNPRKKLIVNGKKKISFPPPSESQKSQTCFGGVVEKVSKFEISNGHE